MIPGFQHRSFFSKRIKFLLQLFIFLLLCLHKAQRHPGLLVDTLRREQVAVLKLVGILAKVGCLDPALVDECFQAIVGFAKADAKLTGELPLGQLGILLELLEKLVAEFVGEFHGWV